MGVNDERKDPNSKGYILCNSIYITFLKRQHWSERGQMVGYQRFGGKGMTTKQ